jgi:hypothetical protein
MPFKEYDVYQLDIDDFNDALKKYCDIIKCEQDGDRFRIVAEGWEGVNVPISDWLSWRSFLFYVCGFTTALALLAKMAMCGTVFHIIDHAMPGISHHIAHLVA